MILDFYAEWCNPCKALSKTLESIEGIEVKKMNIEECVDEVEKYKIKSVPTLVVIDEDGNEINRSVGNISKNQILELCGMQN